MGAGSTDIKVTPSALGTAAVPYETSGSGYASRAMSSLLAAG